MTPPTEQQRGRRRLGRRTFASLDVPAWRLLWSAGHLWNAALWLDLLALGWLVLELTDSPLAVSLVGAARMAPMTAGTVRPKRAMRSGWMVTRNSRSEPP